MSCVDRSIKTFEQAKSCCKKTYNELDAKQQKYIDEFVSACLKVVKISKPALPSLLARANTIASTLTVEDCIKYVQFATNFLKQKEVVNVIEAYVDMYKGLIKDKRRLQAYAKYLQCIIEKLDGKYVKLINAVIALLTVVFKIIAKSSLTPALVDVIVFFHTHMVRPVAKAASKKLRSKKATPSRK